MQSYDVITQQWPSSNNLAFYEEFAKVRGMQANAGTKPRASTPILSLLGPHTPRYSFCF